MAVLRSVSKTDTLETQRQKINLLATDIYDYTSGTTDLAIFRGEYGDGSLSAPSVTFASDTSLGLYKESSGKLGFVSQDKNVISLSSSGTGFLRNFYAEKRSIATSGLTVSAGTGYAQGSYSDVSVQGGRGYGATVDITVNSSGLVSDVQVANGGSGFVVGDVIKIADADISAAPKGVANTISISNAGSTYTTKTKVSTTGGGGNGLTVDITATPNGQVSAVGSLSGGTGTYVTKTNVAVTNGNGNGLTLDITATDNGNIGTVNTIVGGTNYINDAIVSPTGGNGSGASVKLATATGGLVSTYTVNTAGTGYANNTTSSLSGGKGSSATASLVATATNIPSTLFIVYGGLDYEASGTNVTTLSNTGSGTSLTVDFTSVGGVIDSISINQTGNGYAVNEEVSVTSSTATDSATIRVTSITPGGSITSATVVDPGSNYEVGDILDVSGGTGGKLNVESVTGGQITSVTVLNTGKNYLVGDTLIVPGGTGGSFKVATVTGGVITSATVNTPGSGYSVNDLVTISGGSEDATVAVTTIFGGNITNAVVNSAGTGYVVGDIVTVSGVNEVLNQAKLTITDTSDGQGFSAIVTSLDTSNTITANILTGNLTAISFSGTDLTVSNASITSLDSSTISSSISITTPSILSNTDIALSATDDVTVAATNFKVGSNVTIESSNGNILSSGQIKTTGIFNVSDSLNISTNVSNAIIESFDGLPLVLKPSTGKTAKVNSTSALIIPVGTQQQRPQLDAETGAIRFNTTSTQYEGYNASTDLWSSLGGVRDADGNTYLIAELSAGSNDNTFYFYNNNTNTLRITQSNMLFNSMDTIVSNSGNLNINSSITINSDLKFNTNSITTLQSGLTINPAAGTNVVINGTASLAIPVGNTTQRGTSVAGGIRFNTTNQQFEGYSGNNWSSLGGVRDVDGNTYIIPETSAGANENILYFYNNGSHTLRLTQDTLEFREARTISAIDLKNITEWQQTVFLSANTLIYNGRNVYRATIDLTTGSVAPSHTSGTVNNLQWVRTIYSDLSFTDVNNVNINSVVNVNNKLKITNSTISSVTDDITISPFTGKNTVISATTSLVLPVGDFSNVGTAQTGGVRFNTTSNQYEGYNGVAWTSLGGVRDVDGNTYIIPETSAGANENILYFYNNSNNTIQLSATGLKFVSTDNVISETDNIDFNVGSVTFNDSSLVIDTFDSQITKFYSTQNNIDIGLVNGLNNDTFIRLTANGDINLNTSFGEGAYNSTKVLDKSLKYFGMKDFRIESVDINLTKGVTNFGATVLYDPTYASGCKITILAVNQTNNDKQMVDYNIIDKDTDIYNIEYESLLSSSLLFDTVFDFDASGNVRATVSLDDSVSNDTVVKVTVLKTIINN
jgi:hypothetical protein